MKVKDNDFSIRKVMWKQNNCSNCPRMWSSMQPHIYLGIVIIALVECQGKLPLQIM